MKQKVKLSFGMFILMMSLVLFGCKNQTGEKTKETDSPEWESLLQDGDVSQWYSDRWDSFPEIGWSIEGDELIIIGSDYRDSVQAGNLITQQKYGNFELYWEWKMLTVGGNSGVKYFVPGTGDDYSKYGPGPEYQLLDDSNFEWMFDGRMKPNDYRTLGACYELYEPDSTKEPAPLGEWNNSRIVSKDGLIEHWLNGKKILEYNRFSGDFEQRVAKSKFKDFPEFGRIEKGHILLQDHPGEVHFRNIKIKPSDQ